MTVCVGSWAFACADDSSDDVGNDEIGDTTADDTAGTDTTSGMETSDTNETTDDATTTDTGTDTTTTTTDTGTDDATTDTGTTDATTDTGTDDATTDTGTTDATTDTGTSDTGTSDTGTTTTTTTGNNNGCQAPAAYVDCDGEPGNLTNDPFQALGINCGDDPTSTIIAQNAMMNANDADSWRVATAFGTAAGGNYNGKLWAANDQPWLSPNDEEIPANTSTAILILSTGTVEQANGQGEVVEQSGSQTGNGSNQNPDAGGLPPPLSAQYGSNGGAGGTPFMDCDGVNDCSDSLYNHWYVEGWNDPNDKLWMQFDLTVPVGTEGYIFDFAYFSSEFPTYYDTQYNDLFIGWSTSETYTGNITFVNDAPLTITSLEDAGAFQYKANAPELAGTGFEGHAGTGWFVARGSAASEETFQITFFIADMADTALATGVLLDNFRWECAGCIPSEVNSCGILPQ